MALVGWVCCSCAIIRKAPSSFEHFASSGYEPNEALMLRMMGMKTPPDVAKAARKMT
jgi:hypothetical protein